MRKKVVKVGCSLAIIIDKALCSILGIERNTLVRLEIDQGALILRPLPQKAAAQTTKPGARSISTRIEVATTTTVAAETSDDVKTTASEALSKIPAEQTAWERIDKKAEARRSDALPKGLPSTRPRIDMLRALDARGFNEAHFKRLSTENIPLIEFAGTVSRGREVCAIALQRLQLCLSRRQTCKESWDATITAVLAVRSSSDRSDTDVG